MVSEMSTAVYANAPYGGWARAMCQNDQRSIVAVELRRFLNKASAILMQDSIIMRHLIDLKTLSRPSDVSVDH